MSEESFKIVREVRLEYSDRDDTIDLLEHGTCFAIWEPVHGFSPLHHLELNWIPHSYLKLLAAKAIAMLASRQSLESKE